MFPLTQSAVLVVSLSIVFVLTALPIAGRQRLAAFALAGFLFWFLLWRTGPTRGDHYGIYYAFILVALVLVLALAAVWALAAKKISRRSLVATAVFILSPPLIFSGWALLMQSVPENCRASGVPITIAQTELTLPSGDGRWFRLNEAGDLTDSVYLPDKADNSDLCRLIARDGRVEVNSVRVGDRYKATEFSIEPADDEALDWDWNDFQRARTFKSGNIKTGAECYVRDLVLRDGPTQAAYCAVWQPFATDLRAIAVNGPHPDRVLQESAGALQLELADWLQSLQ
ncbi:MAG: hypothetical protein AAFY31_06235 [Pseudomonadota bacterium]